MKKLPLLIALLSANLYATTDLAHDRLEEVFVTSSGVELARRQIGTSVSVIKKEEIELRGYQSFADLMSTQMSVSATGSGGLGKASTLRIRGEEGYRTLILIDGVDVSDPTGVQVGPNVEHLISSGDIERVEILRGPQGFIYGADAGGVVNILTRRADEGSGGGLFAETGRYDSRRLNGYFATGSDSGDLFVSVTELDSAGFNAISDFPEDEADGYNNLTSHAKLGWNLTDDDQPSRVQFVLRNVNAQTEFDNCFPLDSQDCLGNFDQSIGKLSVDLKGQQYSQAVALSRAQIKRENFTDGVSSYSTAGSMETLSYLGNLTLSDTVKVVAGVDGEKQQVEVDSGDDLTRDQLGVFSEFQLIFADMYVNLGARYDDNEDFGEHLSLRISSAYIQPLKSGAQIKYRSSFGSGFRAPSLFEINYNRVSNGANDPAQEDLAALTEEQSHGFDFGVEYHHQGGGFVDIGYFDQQVEDEISFDLTAYRGYLQDSGTSSSSGFEMAFSYPLNTAISVQGNYTYNDTEYTYTDIEASEIRQRSRRPKINFNLGLKGLFVDGRLSVLVNYRELRKRVDYPFGGGKTALDDYAVLDIAASYSFSKKIKSFARVENALDEEYTDIANYNTAGAAVYAGFQYEF